MRYSIEPSVLAIFFLKTLGNVYIPKNIGVCFNGIVEKSQYRRRWQANNRNIKSIQDCGNSSALAMEYHPNTIVMSTIGALCSHFASCTQ